MVKIMVAVNERGIRIGEDHPNAKLTDSEVEMVRELRLGGMTYQLLAEKFEISKSSVAWICTYGRRAQVALTWKAVHVPDL